jgi:hypothetical protein
MHQSRCPICWPNLRAIAHTALETDDYMLAAVASSTPCPHTRRERRNYSRGVCPYCDAGQASGVPCRACGGTGEAPGD